MKAMADHSTGSAPGWWGTIFTFIFLGIGVFDLNKWATIIAIVAGLTTIALNIIKLRNEAKSKQKS